DPMDHGLHLAAIEQWPDVAAQRLRELDLALERARAKRRAGDRQSPQHDVPPVELDLAAMQERDHDEAAFEREAAEVLLDVIASDHVEDHVDAALARDARNLDDEVLRAIVDRMIGAHLPAERGLLVASGRGDDAGAVLLRELDRGQPDAARAAVDQRGLAATQAAAIDQVVPDGEERLRQRRRLDQRESLRDGQAPAGRRRAGFGVPAAGGQRADAIADGHALRAVAQRDDGAGDLETDDR